MAKVIVTFDTVEKDATVTIDGENVDNFQNINIYKLPDDGDGDDDGYGLELTSGIKDKDNDMRTWTRVCSSEGQLTDQKEDNILDQAARLEIQQYFGLDDA